MTQDAGDADLYRRAFRPVLDSGLGRQGLSALLEESGWSVLADSDLPVAVGLLFEEQGRLLATTPALDLVVGRQAQLQAPVAVVHTTTDRPAGHALGGDRVSVEGVMRGAPETAEVLVCTADAVMLVTVDDLSVGDVRGFDPKLALRAVRGTAAARRVSADGAIVTAAARRALAHELVGLAEAMLDIAVDQVVERRQFGRPIATFQTVKHRLAEVKVFIEAAKGSLATAWRTSEPFMALVAKAAAGRAALTAAKHCQQVCGAIGFSLEHRIPAYVRRALVVDVLYGSTTKLEHGAGSDLIDRASVVRPPTPW